MKSVLVVVAHSDDEALGCSGTIAWHIEKGDSVSVVFMTDGVGSRDANVHNKNEREDASQLACEFLGVENIYRFDFLDNQMDTYPLLNIVKKIEHVINLARPSVVYTHHIGDLNVDHQVTHRAVMTACRPQPGFCVQTILAFEVLSSSEWSVGEKFIPNYYVDISKHVNKKINVLSIYSMEMRDPPHTRSVENTMRLAALRGNSVGLEAAEAFILIRSILI